ncbi:hypothetical protein ASPVEDRAFT_40989 [Aspergillus versicolor CBS 583.65]|uniref:DUF7582 domain-containing protein n=1 Tax=Aspergillus versicolor CBS 583.65 TaxID=1036611 RepID=A0A1L9PIR6_ASPVE|nr:uncharacterized protein ASPVEDRAFT_40989 [Aspergillus versicolor CBS 583.65]OJJ01408.1 hypothetical protein ASPVEDRAFT_40989 [Aspergillus versicolor CBS 583.65]
MVAIRLPRPTGVYVPNSPRSVTSDMISSPLAADFNFDAETLTPSIIPALEYISSKLQQKTRHVTLLVGRGKPYPTGRPSDLIVIPSATLEPSVHRSLARIFAKAALKFSLGRSWSDALARSQHERSANKYLIERSILQNEVVFSREGLTLLNVDRIYTFKRRLCILSTSDSTAQNPRRDSYIGSCVRLLHRTIQDFNGRPFSKAFFHRVYEQLDVDDSLLSHVAGVYKKQYKQEGIVIPPTSATTKAPTPTTATTPASAPAAAPPKASPIKPINPLKPTSTVTVTAIAEKKEFKKVLKSPVRAIRIRKQSSGPPLSGANSATRRGPKTPLSASDVTPITRNEWNLLFGPDFRKNRPVVTKWTPSPTVLAAA